MPQNNKHRVTYIPYSSEEFNRRVAIASERSADISAIISSNKNNKAKNRDMRYLLAALFGLLDESLVIRRQPAHRGVGPIEYIERINKGLSSFFFSSYETDAELNRRSLALIDALGNNAEWFLRTKRAKPNVIDVVEVTASEEKVTSDVNSVTTVEEAKAESTTEEIGGELRLMAQLYSDMESKIKNKPVSNRYKVSESELWLAIQKEEDFKQLRTEIKSMFPEVIEDPSGVIDLANKLGVEALLARVRRSYIFNSKD
jgi:hypothetical protein